eukprot:Gb_17011 [translate_table: standard]
MAEPDSWEEMDAQPTHPSAPASSMHSKLNANAPSFTFNVNAPSFAPTPAAYYRAPNMPQTYHPINPINSANTVNPVNPTSYVNPVNPPLDVAPSFVPGPVPSYISAATATGSSSYSPSVDDKMADKHVVQEPRNETLQSEEAGFHANPLSSSLTEGDGTISESKSTDVQMEGEDGSVEISAKETAAANGQTNGYEDQVASDLQSLKVMDSELRQEANINTKDMGHDQSVDFEEPEEEVDKKQHMNVVFIGHVDAGKSTIGGQLLFLTNMVDERTIQKYEREAKEKNRESWYMAYIMDTNEEERAKGKTVEVGRAHFETDKSRVTILDAPGHKSYVPNMISGASQADVGVLVISARKGEFETGFEKGGQTREHATLAKTLGVTKLLVVVNKMDEPSVQWSKERFDEVEKKLTPFLKSCGYNTKKDVQFLPISGLYGTNMKERMPKNVCSWWDGPCLFEALDGLELPLRDPKGPFRMPIIDRFRDMGTVVMGKIESGSVRQGDSLVLMPNKAPVKVVSVYRNNDEVKYARPGENVRVKLSGVEEEDISAGFVLSSVLKPIPAVVEFDAQLQILELLDHKAIFTAGYKAILHIHSIVEECEIIELLQQIDPKTKKPMKKKTLYVKPGAVVMCRIQVNDTICVEKFSDFAQLGRFTLRDEGKTVAIGKVMKLPIGAGQE